MAQQSPTWGGMAWGQLAWGASLPKSTGTLVVYVDPARCIEVASDADIWAVDPRQAELIH